VVVAVCIPSPVGRGKSTEEPVSDPAVGLGLV